MKGRNSIAVFLASFLLLVAVLGVATYFLTRGAAGSAAAGAGDATAKTPSAPEHVLADAPRARFLSIFASGADGSLASYMVGGSTDEFSQFADAVATAGPVDGTSDASFSDLLVFSFGADDSMELGYSRTRNQFILVDRLYQPAVNLAPMISNVEQKFQG